MLDMNNEQKFSSKNIIYYMKWQYIPVYFKIRIRWANLKQHIQNHCLECTILD